MKKSLLPKQLPTFTLCAISVIAVLFMASCVSGPKYAAEKMKEQVTRPKDVHSGDILVLGKVVFVPEIQYEKASEEPGGEPEIANDGLTYLVCSPQVYITKRVFDIYDAGFYVRQGKTFITTSGKAKTIYLRGFYTMINPEFAYTNTKNSSTVSFPLVVYGCFRIDVPAGAKAIYIGTIALGRDELYKPKGFKVIDEYDEAVAALHKDFPDLELVRADMQFIDPDAK